MIVPPPESFPVDDCVTFRFKIKVDNGDISKLLRDGYFWYEQVGQFVQPFKFVTEEKDEETGRTA